MTSLSSDVPAIAPKNHLPFLDLLRGVAILLVLACHSAGASGNYLVFQGWFYDLHKPLYDFLLAPAAMGWVGVAIFFVLSGFCIHLSHGSARDKSFRTFFIRRFFRIYPAYLAALLFYALVFRWSRLDFHGHGWAPFLQLGTHLFLVHNWSEPYFSGINGAFWSLAVEAQLYLLYPLLLLLARAYGWRRMLWITAFIELSLRASAAVCLIFDPHRALPVLYTDGPLTYWFCWTIGAAQAEAYLKKEPIPFARVPLSGCLLLLFAFFWFMPLRPFDFLLTALITSKIIAHCLRVISTDRKSPGLPDFARSVLQTIGIFSYSLYLIHDPLLGVIAGFSIRLGRQHHWPISQPMVFLLLLLSWLPLFLFSYASYRFIEVPGIAWGKRLIRFLDTKRERLASS